MDCTILSIGTATPAHQMSQDEALTMFVDIVCEDKKQSRLARALFRKAVVQNRHTCVPHKVAYDWCQPATRHRQAFANVELGPPSTAAWEVSGSGSHGPTTGERMELFAQHASDIATESARQALSRSGLPHEEVTHLVTVTCTGFDAPGVDIELISRLGLPSGTERIQVGFMGCHGAINGLRAASAITSSNPNAKVLLCAVELCSLHYRFTWDPECIVGNALFADGAASMVLAPQGTGRHQSSARWEVQDTGSCVIPDSRDAMSWQIRDHGFEMRLSSDVGEKIEANLAEWMHGWLAKHELRIEDIDYWGVHPGGPRILDAVQSSLQLEEEALSTSMSILKQNGNMSSPTVLFILEQFLGRQASCDSQDPSYCVLLGFGPGLVAELALLRSA